MKIEFDNDPALEAEINSAASQAGAGAGDIVREAIRRGLNEMTLGRRPPPREPVIDDTASKGAVTVAAGGVVVVLPEDAPVERILAVAHGLKQMRLL